MKQIRFTLSGEHRGEHKMIGTIEGYREFSKRLNEAIDGYDENYKNSDLDLKIDDLMIFNDKSESDDIGFDEFVVDEKCGIEEAQMEIIQQKNFYDKIAGIGFGVFFFSVIGLAIFGAITLVKLIFAH